MRLTFGRFVFDSRLRSVTRDGEPVALSPKAFQLLEALVEARPAPVPNEVLYDRLWPKTFVEAGNLHNLIAEIRRALDDDDHEIVRTARGVGYSFDARDVGMSATSSRFLLWIGDEVVHLRSGENIIGRDPEAAVVIDAPGVSRQHARLFVSDDNVVIEDLGSKNGTFVGSERLSRPRQIGDGDTITLGRTTLLLRKQGNVNSTETIAS
jgi:DNA-binding winged helix-turn-helix (wHTH) protein